MLNVLVRSGVENGCQQTGNTNLASGGANRLNERIQESVALPIPPGFAQNIGNAEACTWKINGFETTSHHAFWSVFGCVHERR